MGKGTPLFSALVLAGASLTACGGEIEPTPAKSSTLAKSSTSSASSSSSSSSSTSTSGLLGDTSSSGFVVGPAYDAGDPCDGVPGSCGIR